MRTMAWRTCPRPSIVSPLRSARRGQSSGIGGSKPPVFSHLYREGLCRSIPWRTLRASAPSPRWLRSSKTRTTAGATSKLRSGPEAGTARPRNSCNSKLKYLDRAFPSTVLTALRDPLFRPHENRTQSRVPTERGVVRCVRANKGDGPAADGATTERMAPFQGTTPKPVLYLCP
jgi:hypothetical protein